MSNAISYKKNVIVSLNKRAIRLENPVNWPKNLKTIKEIMKANNYLPTFYNCTIITKKINS